MRRYVLYLANAGGQETTAEGAQELQHAPTASVIDAQDGMILVDADGPAIEHFLAEHPDWRATTGSAVELPVETGLTRAARFAGQVAAGPAAERARRR